MTMPFTDHHIQDTIIASLVQGEHRFSELVPEGMEHSLFMYHMRKLLKQEIVEKDNQTYRLTHKGSQFYNSRFQLRKPLDHPRALIQFLVIEDNKILLSRRTTALAEQLNEYMLPGGVHFYLASSRTSATQIAKSRGLVAGEFLGSLETIAPSRAYHGLIDIYKADCTPHEKHISAEYEFVWLTLETVADMTFDQTGSAPYIVQSFMTNNLLPRMTWIVGSKPKVP